jgi:ABC-2 type transport system ATP-binding protein
MTAAVTTTLLTRRFGDFTAVDGLDLTVRRGEVYGFLGLNGAGKTTTIRMLLGMVRPSSGDVTLLGEPVRRGGHGPWARVGYLVDAPAPYPQLTVLENLRAAARLRGVPDAAISRAVERLGLAPYADRRARSLSQGNRQRLGLAAALFHEPELVILDEPANGLDPAGVVEVRELLRSLALEQGVTVLMSSHILAEVDRLATRIGIIHHGRLIEELGASELERRRARRLVVRARNRAAARRVLADAGYTLDETGAGDRSGGANSDTGNGANGDGRLILTDEAAIRRPEKVATTLVVAGHPPVHLTVEQEDLEQHFLRLTAQSGPAAKEAS